MNMTPYEAASRGFLDVVKQNVNKSNLNQRGVGGRTLLESACATGQHHIVAYLIELGVDLNSINKASRIALHTAAMNSHPLCAKLMLQVGANCLARNI